MGGKKKWNHRPILAFQFWTKARFNLVIYTDFITRPRIYDTFPKITPWLVVEPLNQLVKMGIFPKVWGENSKNIGATTTY